MSVSPRSDVLQTPALWRLAQCLRHHQEQWHQSEPPPDLERCERALHDHVMAVARDLLADELGRYDVTADEGTVEGVSYRRSLESPQTDVSAAGPITGTRHRYRPAGRRTKSLGPLEWGAGIVPGLWTPRAARQGAWVMAHVTPRESALFFEELGGMPPSVSPLDRLPKTLSARCEAQRDVWAGALRAGETVPEEAAVLAVSLDGVMTPMVTVEPAHEAEVGQTAAGTAAESASQRHSREAGCGTVTLYAAAGKRLATVRSGRMPEEKKATWCAQLEAECQSLLALRPDLKGVKWADGAEENGRFLDQLALGLDAAAQAQVEQVSITDFSHGADPVQQACEVMWGAGSVDSPAECARLRTLRKEEAQGVDKIIGRLRYRVSRRRGRQREQREKALTSFRNQRERMRYAAYRQAHLPIGSGVVEAACKTLGASRLKRSGMRWGIAGGQAVLTLRSVMQSDRWERAWFLLRNDFRKPVTVVEAHGPKVLDPAA